MKNIKKYLLVMIGVVILFPGIIVPGIMINNHNESECENCHHEHEDDLQSSYIVCDCGHSTCTGNFNTCPCCGLGSPPPPLPNERYAHSYQTILGLKSGGSLADTYVIDDVGLEWTCWWFFWWLGFTFGGHVRLYFYQYQATELLIRFYAGRGWQSDGITKLTVYYNDGTDLCYPGIEDGYHEIPLDSSKRVKYVDIEYMELSSVFGGDRYIAVDKIAIVPV